MISMGIWLLGMTWLLTPRIKEKDVMGMRRLSAVVGGTLFVLGIVDLLKL